MTTQNTDTLTGDTLLRRTGLAWYLAAAVGQSAFVWMIAAHYGRKTLSGDYRGWNDKPLITGYVEGDIAGNVMFAAHVLLAAVITAGGLIQLIPLIRDRLPGLHRWNGRLFLLIACVMAFGGMWLTWVRHTYLSLVSGIAVTVDGLLILFFSAAAWRLAMTRRFDAHRRWAMRAFMAVNGVWFLRVGIMGWMLLGHGTGMTNTLSGPADVVLQFGAYLIPLAVLEVYLRARRGRNAVIKRLTSGLVLLMTAFMAIGIFGAVAFMWGPYM